jgi:hypothetical protein
MASPRAVTSRTAPQEQVTVSRGPINIRNVLQAEHLKEWNVAMTMAQLYYPRRHAPKPRCALGQTRYYPFWSEGPLRPVFLQAELQTGKAVPHV